MNAWAHSQQPTRDTIFLRYGATVLQGRNVTQNILHQDLEKKMKKHRFLDIKNATGALVIASYYVRYR